MPLMRIKYNDNRNYIIFVYAKISVVFHGEITKRYLCLFAQKRNKTKKNAVSQQQHSFFFFFDGIFSVNNHNV